MNLPRYLMHWSHWLLLLLLSISIIPAQAASCSTPCLQIHGINMSSMPVNGLTRITASITAVDQDGAVGGARGAVIHARWSRPDGSSLEQYATISARGRADFRLYTSAFGTYQLSVLDINKPGYQFIITDPSLLAAILVLAETGNQTPTAVMNVDRSSGTAPLSILFDASGSSDSDGSIQSYHWDFGDGSSAEGIQATHSYDQPGSYLTTLVVTDDLQATASQSMEIIVDPANTACTANCIRVSKLTLSVFRPRWSPDKGRVTAKVWVQNELNQSMQDVTVHATWTLPDGSQIEQSRYIDPGSWKWFADLEVSARQTGEYRLTINNVSADGYQFSPEQSKRLEASITVSP